MSCDLDRGGATFPRSGRSPASTTRRVLEVATADLILGLTDRASSVYAFDPDGALLDEAVRVA